MSDPGTSPVALRSAAAGLLVVLASLCACGDSTPGSSSTDGGSTLPIDGAVPPSDTGADAPIVDADATRDSSVDAHADAGNDAPIAVDAPTGPDAALAGWTLTWSDEFDGPDGSALDSTKWSYDTGGTGWGNNELEYYTSGTNNAVIQSGTLVITATNVGASSQTCSYGPCQFTSARVQTEGKFEQKYGRFEARIKLPTGSGTWPAFWMLGNDIGTNGWPACGEIDIMEAVGSDAYTVHGTTHGPGGPAGYAGEGISGSTSLPSGGPDLSADFHVYAVEWTASSVAFSMDGTVYETVVPSSLPSGATWVFDHPYFIILNFAVGGTWPGSPSPTETWPKTMVVDYVRAYEPAP
jgi:beta-glucanase (GH16 family)